MIETMETCRAGTITVEQAVFASSDRGRMKGYQIVSKSPGVDRPCSQELCRWAPSQLLDNDPESWTINCFPVSADFVAVTRTVLGGPEYSGRGGTQVVTLILLLRDEQFMQYQGNAISVARTAMANGNLMLPLNMGCEELPLMNLPGRPFVEPPDDHDNQSGDKPKNEWLTTASDLIAQGRRIAVIGLTKPADGVEQLIARLPLETRKTFSFTTGLAPAVRRPFQAHFLPIEDAARQRTLDAQQIVRVSATTGQPI